MEHHRRAFEHRARSDIDDLAIALAAHDRQHRLDALERSARIDRHHLVPFLRGDLGEWLQRDLAEQGGIVNQHLNAAKCSLGCLYQRRYRLRVPDIAGPANRLAASVADCLHYCVGWIEVAYADPCALSGQCLGIRGADALRRTGNDRRGSVQSCHRDFPLCR
jgi:hypothetical protein